MANESTLVNLHFKYGDLSNLPQKIEQGTIYFAKDNTDGHNNEYGYIYYDNPNSNKKNSIIGQGYWLQSDNEFFIEKPILKIGSNDVLISYDNDPGILNINKIGFRLDYNIDNKLYGDRIIFPLNFEEPTEIEKNDGTTQKRYQQIGYETILNRDGLFYKTYEKIYQMNEDETGYVIFDGCTVHLKDGYYYSWTYETEWGKTVTVNVGSSDILRVSNIVYQNNSNNILSFDVTHKILSIYFPYIRSNTWTITDMNSYEVIVDSTLADQSYYGPSSASVNTFDALYGTFLSLNTIGGSFGTLQVNKECCIQSSSGNPAILNFQTPYTDSNGEIQANDPSFIRVYDNGDNNNNGQDMLIQSKSRLILGSGENAEYFYEKILTKSPKECLYLMSDSTIKFYTQCQNWNSTPSVKGKNILTLDSSGCIPGINNSYNIGSSSYKWANGYFTNGYFTNGHFTTGYFTDGHFTNLYSSNETIEGSLNAPYIELGQSSALAGSAQNYIDFHCNKSTADYTSRIIETQSGVLNINKVNISSTNDIGESYIKNENGVLNINNVKISSAKDGEIYYIGNNTTKLALSSSALYIADAEKDGKINLGSFSDSYPRRWNQVYAVKGTISTSDARSKIIQNSFYLDNLIKVYDSIDPVAYKWENNNESNNHDRIHVGLLSQQVEEKMLENNLTRLDFGGLCVDPIYDDNGNQIDEIYGLRYSEFHGLHILKNHQQDERIANLENQIANLKTQLELLKLSIGG